MESNTALLDAWITETLTIFASGSFPHEGWGNVRWVWLRWIVIGNVDLCFSSDNVAGFHHKLQNCFFFSDLMIRWWNSIMIPCNFFFRLKSKGCDTEWGWGIQFPACIRCLRYILGKNCMNKTPLLEHIYSATPHQCECFHLLIICVYNPYCYPYKMIVKDMCPVFSFSVGRKRAFCWPALVLLLLMKSIFSGAPPSLNVASTTAGLRDDVGCIWARAAGSVSPFTAIRAESRSSPGPFHCAEPLYRSSRRAYSEGKVGLYKERCPNTNAVYPSEAARR